MRRIFLAASIFGLAVGCTPASTEKQNHDNGAPNKETKVQVHAPGGVDVNIEKGEKKKVDVDVHPNR